VINLYGETSNGMTSLMQQVNVGKGQVKRRRPINKIKFNLEKDMGRKNKQPYKVRGPSKNHHRVD
jgi:hypothetical protein